MTMTMTTSERDARGGIRTLAYGPALRHLLPGHPRKRLLLQSETRHGRVESYTVLERHDHPDGSRSYEDVVHFDLKSRELLSADGDLTAWADAYRCFADRLLRSAVEPWNVPDDTPGPGPDGGES
jgi:hypothetical protein